MSGCGCRGGGLNGANRHLSGDLGERERELCLLPV